jgi:methylenetetrahydrofolate reductase (NADPH)
VQVAGYPEAHPDVISENSEQMREAYWKDIHYLKEKVCASGL